MENEDKAVMEKSDTEVKTVIDNHERNWEILAFQAEIETLQKDLEQVYSDDEGTGVGTLQLTKLPRREPLL